MIIGGSVIVETVFNIPGMGRLAVTSVLNQDYPYVQGIILIVVHVHPDDQSASRPDLRLA